MTKAQQRQLDRFRSIVGFGARHQNEFASDSKAALFFTQAVDILNEVEALAEAGRKQSTAANSAEKTQLSQQILAILERMSSTARQLEKQNSYFVGKFPMPDKRRSNVVAEIAKAQIDDAAPVLDEFFDYEMPQDFWVELKSLVEQYEAHGDASPTFAPARDDKKQRIDHVLMRSGEVTEALDIILNNKYRGQFQVLAEWVEAKCGPRD